LLSRPIEPFVRSIFHVAIINDASNVVPVDGDKISGLMADGLAFLMGGQGLMRVAQGDIAESSRMQAVAHGFLLRSSSE
jgi:hypothetical protein